jgi:uncharacterized protein YbcI
MANRQEPGPVTALKDEGERGAISDAAVRLAHTTMRRGSPTATTTFGDDSVTVLIQGIDGQAQGSLFGPSAHEVVRLRGEIHRGMREDLVDKIERQLGRRVLAFVDESSPDRDTISYMYLLVGSPSVS